MNTDKKWAVIVALPHEAKAILPKMVVNSKTAYLSAALYQGQYRDQSRSYPLLLLRTGLGANNAREATRFLCEHFQFTHLLITGYCGGLQEGLNNGDAILAAQVKTREDPSQLAFDKVKESQCLLAILQDKQIPAQPGMLIQSKEPLRTSEQKRKLYEETGALAVDMESYAVLESLAQYELKTAQKITSFVLRFVVDAHEHELADTKSFVNDQGGVRPFKLAGEMIKAPRLIKDLSTLEQLAERARTQLAKSVPLILKGL